MPINGLFVPTSEGIVLIDGTVQPCQTGAINWIKEELERRYDVPVRNVVTIYEFLHRHREPNDGPDIPIRPPR
jgi:hypothetical protein